MAHRGGRFHRSFSSRFVLLLASVGLAFFSTSRAQKSSTDKSAPRSVVPDRAPIAETPRGRSVTDDGILVVYDAPVADDVAYEKPPFFALWRHRATGEMLVYSSLLFDQSDLADAVAALNEEVSLDPPSLDRLRSEFGIPATTPSARPSRFVTRNSAERWHSLTWNALLELSGFDPADWPMPEGFEEDHPDDATVFDQGGCYGAAYGIPGLPTPGPIRTPHTLFPAAVNTVPCPGSGGGGDGGDSGDEPPPPRDCDGDKDCDGVPNGQDDDVDGDGILNGSDPDVDGDGVGNGDDPDADDDGLLNGNDPDIDGDDHLNGDDPDVDGDGVNNGNDPDVNGDGIVNGGDPDIDGDGSSNVNDDDPDGDGANNGTDNDDDGDGTPDTTDPSPQGCTGPDCKGACCNTTTGGCTLRTPANCTAANLHYNGIGVPCAPNPCCPYGTNPPFPPSSATISQTTKSWAWDDNCLYGKTKAEAITPDDVDVTAVCNGTQWCAVLTRVNGRYSVDARLVPGQAEVTGPWGGNTTASNACDQATELHDLGYCDPGEWYMLAAVWAHENVHVAQAQPALQFVASDREASIESICISHIPGRTQSDAIREIRELVVFDFEIDILYSLWRDRTIALSGFDHAADGPCDVAEHLVVDPMVGSICGFGKSMCWPECPACPTRPTGACCTGTTGACLQKTQCQCDALNGTYKGDGTACQSPSPCTGACCGPGPGFSCTLTTAAGCSMSYHGDGTYCTATICLPPG